METAYQGRPNHSRNSHTDTFTSSGLLVIRQGLLKPTRKLFRQNLNVSIRLKTTDCSELAAHQIRHHDIGARSTNINSSHTALPRIDIQQSRFATAADSLANSALEN